MINRRLAYIVKDQDPVIMPASESVQRACGRMCERRVGAVLVSDGKGRLVGIFTGRDAMRAAASGTNPAKTTLAEVMTPEPRTIAPERTAIDALRAMSDGGFRHLPIVADGRILGIVSRGDFKGMELDRLEEETHLWERIC
ncbi:MAG: CBS domain-containing protein [Burkholderiales bacterium]|nr:CBS domain-containing protein [Burkholderiales bacterium]